MNDLQKGARPLFLTKTKLTMEITLEQLDELSIENEKKNQRIRELEECLKESFFALFHANKVAEYGTTGWDKKKANSLKIVRDFEEKAKQLLNQKQ